MVPIEKVKPVLAVEEGEEPEHIVVDLDDLAHPSVFPELVAVAKLNIGEALCVIMLQGSKVKILIFQKIVVGCSVAPVAVTEKTEAAAGGYRDRGGISESPLKTGMTAHFCLAPFMQRRIRRTEKEAAYRDIKSCQAYSRNGVSDAGTVDRKADLRNLPTESGCDAEGRCSQDRSEIEGIRRYSGYACVCRGNGSTVRGCCRRSDCRRRPPAWWHRGNRWTHPESGWMACCKCRAEKP